MRPQNLHGNIHFRYTEQFRQKSQKIMNQEYCKYVNVLLELMVTDRHSYHDRIQEIEYI